MPSYVEYSVEKVRELKNSGFLFTPKTVFETSPYIAVTDDEPQLVRFFSIPEGSELCGNITEYLYEEGSIPSGGGCCGVCLDAPPEAKRLGKRCVTCADACKPICINWCHNTLLFITPGLYRITIPTEWIGFVIATITTVKHNKYNNRIIII